MYICRVHGEPLIFNHIKFILQCPEFSVCGTYVTEELVVWRLLGWDRKDMWELQA